MARPHPYRQARQLLGLTQIKCARRAGISQSRLSLIEAGYVLPSEAEARRLAKVVGEPHELLFPATREPRPGRR
jgi:transcriptional regulator with XRE-family HTH domain